MSDPENPTPPEPHADAMSIGPESEQSVSAHDLSPATMDSQAIVESIQRLKAERLALLGSIEPGQDIPPEVRERIDELYRQTLELSAEHIQKYGTSGMNPN